ncbi:zf-HC2 domain-containing protein [Corynebacterium halotolerans]|uniref:Putative zinc-finger domain-containing protein n=1 Tax=Corynebacterium halotolerans YIM 70093 = DSM 44683 TaxID=1121362 RepID=M1NWM9_9CORY|nr:zf-HC2 domain-containing protein [Corynebacterium halotolerans]AGF71895.1 hypothetical protein A605_04420 [Corynebacterium halotolerans YIM 70093 = DSM 44683]
MLDHDQVQAALSARLDGEPSGLPDDVVDAHVAGCGECRAFWERSLTLNHTLSLAGMQDSQREELTAPDLSETILAGVEPEWRRSANVRFIGLSVSRVLLVLIGVAYVVWSVRLLGATGGLTAVGSDGATLAPDADPQRAQLLAEGAAFRLALAFGLFTAAWKPRLVVGMLPVVGALWTFMFGFTIRDVIVGTAGGGQVVGLVLLLVTALAMGWVWLTDHGYLQLRSAWRELGARPNRLA